MPFYFGDKKGDALLKKIHLRGIRARAKEWDHGGKGLSKYYEGAKKVDGDILKIAKNERELFAISLFAFAMSEDTGEDWWTAIPDKDPPDGLVMTLVSERGGLMARLREIEVVEHRSTPEELIEVISNKMIAKSYVEETVLVCLGLSPAVYDFDELTRQIEVIDSTIDHIFIVFPGVAMNLAIGSRIPEKVIGQYSMEQLLPQRHAVTFNLRSHLEEFTKRYNAGQESRLIDGNSIYFGTCNP